MRNEIFQQPERIESEFPISFQRSQGVRGVNIRFYQRNEHFVNRSFITITTLGRKLLQRKRKWNKISPQNCHRTKRQQSIILSWSLEYGDVEKIRLLALNIRKVQICGNWDRKRKSKAYSIHSRAITLQNFIFTWMICGCWAIGAKITHRLAVCA